MPDQPELDDVQGNILQGYGAGHAWYLLLHAGTAGAGRRCLERLVPAVTTAAHWPDEDGRPVTTLNLAVTVSGFARLGVRPDLLARFPQAFREGPAHRADRLGDTGGSAPGTWERGLGTGEGHLLVTLQARTSAALEDARDRLRELVDADDALCVVQDQRAHTLDGRREHFGFADGFAQPEIEGVDRRARSRRSAATAGGGVPLRDGGWRPLKVGEFLLGHEDEDGGTVTDPHPRLVRNGSYLVYRKLAQDVAAFRRGLARAAEVSGLPEELVAAKAVGRWRDGTSLLVRPDRDPHQPLEDSAAPDPSNDFRFRHDPDGYLVPRGAHIRRVNPRDALDFGGAVPDPGRLSARHRIIRRGVPYGEVLPPGVLEDDGTPRGLVFVCFNADIERQFETIQRHWCHDGDSFGLGEDRDFLLGGAGGSGRMVIPVRHGCPRFVDTVPEIVRTRGAEYAFAPGLQALRDLAEGVFG